MTKQIEDKLLKIPILGFVVMLLKRIPIPGLSGMSLYDILEMYVRGIVRGAVTTRAGGIAFSFFDGNIPLSNFYIDSNPLCTN